ncbi:N-acetylmannosamine-6-phosphate 2-epimerase [Cohnella herbarum]|uniref:Putative N-acetylmannosamine-6-phosphate 2-epimerase n=1 Tax=Cohnella herbarum TaxID=2728023 RepID=A0A7Z2VN48_9BACL|nr:N-acetylmannosamine-6-phosphate 2-epimerase [Cohnella herbarum]QJD86042.1 N-acetylmannosamine-6-phosphate 2-epimerase [Cohnella herbarum]
MTQNLIAQLAQNIIVSCQALEDEPLYGPEHMAVMAVAAEEGGAIAIRANTPQDVRAIKRKCKLPIIGLYKKDYPDSAVYITPTIREVKEIAEAGAEFVAIDATSLTRPGGEKLEHFVQSIREECPGLLIVADVSTYEEGVTAMGLGVDLVSTTMSGYTPQSMTNEGPDIELVRRLSALGGVPVLAEGRIWTPSEAAECLKAGAYAVVVGTAITRPQEITRRFATAILEAARQKQTS